MFNTDESDLLMCMTGGRNAKEKHIQSAQETKWKQSKFLPVSMPVENIHRTQLLFKEETSHGVSEKS
jgi:hypothetical protein